MMLSMTVTPPYLCGAVNDPHVAGRLVDDPHTNYLCGLVNDPCVADGLVDDPHTNYLHGLIDHQKQHHVPYSLAILLNGTF